MKTAQQAVRQIDKFRETAREREADESEAAFDTKLKRIATAKPKEPAKQDK